MTPDIPYGTLEAESFKTMFFSKDAQFHDLVMKSLMTFRLCETYRADSELPSNSYNSDVPLVTSNIQAALLPFYSNSHTFVGLNATYYSVN